MKTEKREVYKDRKDKKKGKVSYELLVPETEEELEAITGIKDSLAYICNKLRQKVDSRIRQAVTKTEQFNPGTKQTEKVTPLNPKKKDAVAEAVTKFSVMQKKKKNGPADLSESELIDQMRQRMLKKGIAKEAVDEFIAQYREVADEVEEVIESPPADD